MKRKFDGKSFLTTALRKINIGILNSKAYRLWETNVEYIREINSLDHSKKYATWHERRRLYAKRTRKDGRGEREGEESMSEPEIKYRSDMWYKGLCYERKPSTSPCSCRRLRAGFNFLIISASLTFVLPRADILCRFIFK